jgi:serine/threonine-protein kinase HipA
MVKLAGDILAHRSALVTNVTHDTADALATILKIGTSAGGARPKAVIAWNPRTGEVRSGQVRPPRDFEPWILKFDGVNDTALGDPRGFGRVEYAYYKMAIAAGIDMSECRLLTEGPRAHFMTRRFDRDINGDKIHMQSLCALCHFDFNAPGAYGYEQAFSAIQRLNIGHEAIEELYRRMVFNVIARNHDDHTRNLAFLMDRSGAWKLAPAFDMIWSYNPRGAWTNRHQMRINGKLDEFTREDLQAPAGACRIRNAADIIAKVKQAVARWPDFAAEAGVEPAMSRSIGGTHRMNMP